MKTRITITILSALIYLSSCSEQYLDAKSDTNLVTPQNLDDIISLLDNMLIINMTGGLGQMATDEYHFVDDEAWLSTFYATERNAYIWAKDIYEGQSPIQDWNIPYESIFYANNALQTLKKLNLPTSPERDQVKGWALFIRAYAYHDLVRNFCLAYDPGIADSDLGLPIRLSPRIDEIQPRASLQQTYNQILTDLKEATKLLSPQFQETNRNRPSKATAYALLARVYLMMNDFDNAEKNADNSLALYNKLIDYNTVSTTDIAPFTKNNDEVLLSAKQFGAYGTTANAEWNTWVTVNPNILELYHENDLRVLIFFAQNSQGNFYVKTGYYGGGSNPFHGLAVDELYLIKSECLARRGEITAAMDWLNELLVNRFKNSKPYEPLTADNQEEAISVILEERKKELIWRGIRWSDIKRLNRLGENITLKREVNGTEYTLPPNDIRYAFPIPDDEITRSNIQQNPR